MYKISPVPNNPTPLVLLIIALACVSAPAFACMMSQEEKVALFNEFDLNHDGMLSQEEYVENESVRTATKDPEGIARLKQHFLMDMDVQKRGFIGLESFSPLSLFRCR